MFTEQVPILDETQRLRPGDSAGWLNWKLRIWALCGVKGLQHHLDGTSQRPRANDANTDKWDRVDALAKAILILNINDPVGLGIGSEMSAASHIWSMLVRRYEDRGRLAAFNAEEHLKAKRYREGDDLEEHWVELHRRLAVARSLGAQISDGAFALILCHSVPASMDYITTHLLTNPDPEDVTNQITSVYQSRLFRSKAETQLSSPAVCSVQVSTKASRPTEQVPQYHGVQRRNDNRIVTPDEQVSQGVTLSRHSISSQQVKNNDAVTKNSPKEPQKLNSEKRAKISRTLSDGSILDCVRAREFMDYYCKKFELTAPEITFARSQCASGERIATMYVGGRPLGMGIAAHKVNAEMQCYLHVVQSLEAKYPDLWRKYSRRARKRAH